MSLSVSLHSPRHVRASEWRVLATTRSRAPAPAANLLVREEIAGQGGQPDDGDAGESGSDDGGSQSSGGSKSSGGSNQGGDSAGGTGGGPAPECEAGDERTGETVCGINGRGHVFEECVDGAFQESTRCDDPDECVDDEEKWGDLCTGGTDLLTCTSGSWVAECVDAWVVTLGTLQQRRREGLRSRRGTGTATSWV